MAATAEPHFQVLRDGVAARHGEMPIGREVHMRTATVTAAQTAES
jgi:hypothetical protein